MTVVVGAVRNNSVILISDSRATAISGESDYVSSDNLQKIVGLNQGLIAGYAGDVASVNAILLELKLYIDSNPTLEQTLSKASELSGGEFFKTMRAFSLLLAVKNANSWRLYCFSVDDKFIAQEVKTTKVIGSGSIVGIAIEKFHTMNSSTQQTDKEYADKLIRSLTSLLASKKVQYVGGLPQALVLHESGIKTIHTGYVQMAPEELPDSKQIFFENGRWVQKDHAKGSELMVIGPSEMLNENANSNVFHNYETSATSLKDMSWYVNAFLPCRNVSLNPDSVVINGGLTSLVVKQYPNLVKFQVYLSLYGPSTGHRMVILLKAPDGSVQTLHEVEFDNDNFPMEYEKVLELEMNIISSGEHFLECEIDNVCRISRLINVDDYSQSLTEEENFRKSSRKQSAYTDPRHEASIPHLALFSLSNDEPIIFRDSTIINKQFSAVYIKNYPLEFNAYAYMLVQGNPGKYKFRIRLFDASTHATSYEFEGEIELTSVLLKKPMLVKLTLKFPKAGYYFFCVYFNDVMKGVTVVIADTAPPSLGFSLSDSDVEALLKNNIYHVLAKRPVKMSEH